MASLTVAPSPDQTSLVTATSFSKPSFLNLPPEIRLYVYGHLFDEDFVVAILNARGDRDIKLAIEIVPSSIIKNRFRKRRAEAVVEMKKLLAILNTNRLLRTEAGPEILALLKETQGTMMRRREATGVVIRETVRKAEMDQAIREEWRLSVKLKDLASLMSAVEKKLA